MYSFNGRMEILLNKTKFINQVVSLEKAGKKINDSTKSVPDPRECQGLVLSDWVDRFREIGDLVSMYKQLIEKDCFSIKESQKVLEGADRDRAGKIIGR